MRALGRSSRLSRTGLLVLVVVLLTGSGGVRAEEEAPTPEWVSHTGGLEAIGITSLRIHSKAPDTLWACVDGMGICRSNDQGGTWAVKQAGIDARHQPTPRDRCVISLDPKDEKVIWAVCQGHVYRSGDQGESWVDKTTGALSSWSWDRRVSTHRIRGVVVHPRKSNHILAGTLTRGAFRGGLFESTDNGDSWEQIAGAKREDEELYDCWPIVLDPRTDKIVVVGGTNGFWYSDDRGRSFRQVDPGKIGRHHVRVLTEMEARGRDLFLCDGRGLWGSRDGGKRWDKKPILPGDAVTAYADPYSRKRMFAVLRDRGLLVSEDGRHAKWDELGHADLELRELLADPRNEDLLFAASPATGLHTSADNGATLDPVGSDVKPVVPGIVAVALHPKTKERALAISEDSVVFQSTDRGASWSRAGRVGMEVTTLYGDPQEDDAWWAAGRALRKSVDNGATWETVYAPDDSEETILAVERLDDGTVYLLLERARVVVSSKDGKTWTETKAPEKAPGSWAASFAVDRTNPARILMATRTLAHRWTPKDEEGGPWESWDGGKTWKPVVEGLFEGKKADKPKPEWNRGRWVAIDPVTGVSFYAADGLGFFARLPLDEKTKDKPAWVEVGPGIPNLRVNAALLRALGDDDAELILQGEGANDTRTLEKTTTKRVLARLEAKAKGAEDGEGGDGDAPAPEPLWDEMPGPPARLADLEADPQVLERLIGCDRDGSAGVLVFGIPGETGLPAEGPVPAPGPMPAGGGPVPPEGLLAFTAGRDGAIRVWGLAEGKVYQNLTGHTDEVLAVALAPDESVIATGSADKSIRLYNGADGKPLDKTLAPDTYSSTVNAIVFHPDSKRLYAALQENWAVVEWNLETGATRAFEAHTGGVVALAVTPDGKHVISGSRDRTIRCFDVETGKATCKIDTGTEVLAIALSPDGTKVYAGGRGTAVRTYDISSGEEVAKGSVQRAYVSGLALSPDGSRLYVAGDSGVVAVDPLDLTPLAPAYTGPEKAVFSVAVSKDGEWIVGGDADSGLWLWHRDTAKPRWFSTTAHAGSILCVALTPDVAEKAPAEGAPPDGAGGG